MVTVNLSNVKYGNVKNSTNITHMQPVLGSTVDTMIDKRHNNVSMMPIYETF
jgi:hypothetical protein